MRNLDNLEVIKKLDESGVPIIAGPVELHDQVHDRMNTIITAGPNGELVQLFER